MDKYVSLDSKLGRAEFFRGWLLGGLVLAIFHYFTNKFFFTSGRYLALITIGLTVAFMFGVVPLWMGARFRDAGKSGKWAFLAIP